MNKMVLFVVCVSRLMIVPKSVAWQHWQPASQPASLSGIQKEAIAHNIMREYLEQWAPKEFRWSVDQFSGSVFWNSFFQRCTQLRVVANRLFTCSLIHGHWCVPVSSPLVSTKQRASSKWPYSIGWCVAFEHLQSCHHHNATNWMHRLPPYQLPIAAGAAAAKHWREGSSFSRTMCHLCVTIVNLTIDLDNNRSF